MNIQDNKKIPELQSFILQLHQLNLQKVQQTFVGMCANSEIDNMSNEEVQQQNQYLRQKFSLAVLGKKQIENSAPFQQLTIHSATLWLKHLKINGKSIRLIFFPFAKYKLDKNQGPKSYKKMLMHFFLFNKFLKPQLTKNITLISVSFMENSQIGKRGKQQVLKMIPHITKTLGDLTKQFNLKSVQIMSKVVFIIFIEQKKQQINFGDEINRQNKSGKINKQNKTYILTNDEVNKPLYALDVSGSSIRLQQESTDLLMKVNHLQIEECHLHFNYNRFLSYKPQLSQDNILDLNASNELWAVFLVMIRPIYIVKQQFQMKYSCLIENNLTQHEANLFQQQQTWNCQYQLNLDLSKFNDTFGFNQWKSKCQTLKPNIKKPQQKLLASYTEQFSNLAKFNKQEQNFNHAIILDLINRISKDFKDTSIIFQRQDDKTKRFLLERKVLEFSKIIVRFLKSLKVNSLSSMLYGYQSEFYEHLIAVYSQAYDQFCWANKKVFGKVFDLSRRMKTLKSSKQLILTAAKKVDNPIKIYKFNDLSIEQLNNTKLFLHNILTIFQKNKSTIRDREVDVMILSMKYQLGSTYEKLALLQDFGSTGSQNFKNALKIIFYDLYLHLFLENKNFEQQYAGKVLFTEFDLLKKISGILKALDRLDLSIQIEKKQGNHTVIQNYYNRWLMKYRGEMRLIDSEETEKILLKAIEYFKVKCLPEKVGNYYSLLIKNSRSLEGQKKYEMERLDYEADISEPANKKTAIQKAKSSTFPITKNTADDIMRVCKARNS